MRLRTWRRTNLGSVTPLVYDDRGDNERGDDPCHYRPYHRRPGAIMKGAMTPVIIVLGAPSRLG